MRWCWPPKAALVERADAVLEGFRPGVAERLGIGPEACLRRNTRLVYGRMTGWGQGGPYAAAAGHDINFLALTGALYATGRAGAPPPPPLNLVGDFGGGGMLLALGVVAALHEARRSGRGQVIDAAIVDGVSLLMAMVFGMHARGHWNDQREGNLLDGGCPYYDTYRCADGRYIAVGAIEDKFYAELLRGLGLADDPDCTGERTDPTNWPTIRDKFAVVFAGRSRHDWVTVFERRDACVTPVLALSEVPHHRHHVERSLFLADGSTEPAPAPRFSRTVLSHPPPAPHVGEHTLDILAELGLAGSDVRALLDRGAALVPPQQPGTLRRRRR